ncbi:MAG: GH116 family glycosyl hydrolase [Candidatus Aminicenantales bacterium]
MRGKKRLRPFAPWGILAFLCVLAPLSTAQEGLIPRFEIERGDLTLSRLAQPNTYFDKAGHKFALLGLESGTFEAWAYPLKLLRNFEFSFLIENSTRPIPGREIVRFVEVTPAATTLTFTHQSFTVKAAFVAAIEEPGAVILLDIDSTGPLTVIAGFLPVLQPMWPAGIGGQYAYWDDSVKAYLISEPTRKNHAFVGSPAAKGISYTPAHMLSDTPNEFTIVIDDPEKARGRLIPVVLAGGKGKREDIRKIYEKMAADPESVYVSADEYYRKLRRNTLRVKTPVAKLNLALEWAKVSYDNLRVDNPDLGCGLVAGLGLSGTGGRPGFGWFFGTDAYLNSLSLSSYGAHEAAREALAFTRKWQREDGKMAHELSQAAGYIDWFKDYPYGYIHADTTPYYIAACHDYFRWSGDREFLKESWPSLRLAYEWCLTTDGDGDGLMDNSKAGLGALEFGALTGIQTDIYLAAVWIRAAGAMSELARVMGEDKLAQRARADHEKALAAFESRFWDEAGGHYSYAFNAQGEKVKELTPWCAVPLMWEIGRPDRASRALENMSASELTTRWGVRILTRQSPLYEPLNYNYGAVWPFLTGYFAAALYRHGFPLQGYGLVEANADHIFDNALGCATELFSGAQYVWPQEAVAHQGFSTGGFVLPFVRGMLGLEGDAAAEEADFAPRLPADWPGVTVENFRLGPERFDLKYVREKESVRLEVTGRPESGFKMLFAPSFGPGTEVLAVRVNGQSVDFKMTTSPRLARPEVGFHMSGRDTVEIDLKPTVEILPPSVDSKIGDPDRGLKIISIIRERDELKALVEGWPGQTYSLPVACGDFIRAVQGAKSSGDRLTVAFPAAKEPCFLRQEIILKLRE